MPNELRVDTAERDKANREGQDAAVNQDFSSDTYAALRITTIQEFLSQNKWQFSGFGP